MIAYSIVFLRCLFLMVTLVLCSRHSLAESSFLLIERGGEPKTGAVWTSTPGATSLAILEILDYPESSYYSSFTSSSGLNVIPVDRLVADTLKAMVPHIQSDLRTAFCFSDKLFTLLDYGSGTNMAATGESPEQRKHELRLSIELNPESVRNEKDLKRLADGLNTLQAGQVTYLMTHFAYDQERGTVVITFKVWTPDLEISKKVIAQSLHGYQHRLQPMISPRTRFGQGATRDTGRTTERDTALGEGSPAGIAPGNDPAGTVADIHGAKAVAGAATAFLLYKAVKGNNQGYE